MKWNLFCIGQLHFKEICKGWFLLSNWVLVIIINIGDILQVIQWTLGSSVSQRSAVKAIHRRWLYPPAQKDKVIVIFIIMITITIITVCVNLDRRMNSHLFTFSSKLFVKGLCQLHQIPTGWLIQQWPSALLSPLSSSLSSLLLSISFSISLSLSPVGWSSDRQRVGKVSSRRRWDSIPYSWRPTWECQSVIVYINQQQVTLNIYLP